MLVGAVNSGEEIHQHEERLAGPEHRERNELHGAHQEEVDRVEPHGVQPIKTGRAVVRSVEAPEPGHLVHGPVKGVLDELSDDERQRELLRRMIPRDRIFDGVTSSDVASDTSATSSSVPKDSFDVVVEASGSPDAFELAHACVLPRGHIVLKSTYHGNVSCDMSALVVKVVDTHTHAHARTHRICCFAWHTSDKHMWCVLAGVGVRHKVGGPLVWLELRP